jgi:ABC-type phosphate transport system permease subunit
MNDPRTQALAIFLAEQAANRPAHWAQSKQLAELHLHHHHYAAPEPSPVAEPEPQTVRLHPIFVATYMLFLSIAISVPLALLAAIVDSTNRPSVQYVQPQQGGW